jgi:hypothetical protein
MRVIDTCWDQQRIIVRIVVEREDASLTDLANEIEAEVEGDFLPDVSVRVIVEEIGMRVIVGEFKPFDGTTARVFARREG